MSEQTIDELREAYLKTNYVIKDGTVQLKLRIGERNAQLDGLLAQHKAQSCAFFTAYNPRSKRLSDAENKSRQKMFLDELKTQNYQYFHGYGASDSGDWQPEPSVLILAVNQETALDLARRYEQNAFVYVEEDCAPVLVWLNQTVISNR